MRHFTVVSLCVLFAFSPQRSSAQMAGTYSVPGTFSSLAVAINSLNTVGVTGPVTINIQSGYTETVTTGGYSLFPVAGSSSLNTITFQKNGTGADPEFRSYVGTNYAYSNTQDGLWRFIGTDNINLIQLDFTDINSSLNPANQMEFGLGFFKYNSFDGCQNNHITGCKVTLKQANNQSGSTIGLPGSRAIEFVNAESGTHILSENVSSFSGSHSYNSVQTCTISDCNFGICFNSIYNPGTNTAYYDRQNIIGGSSVSDGNLVINFGNGTVNSSSTPAGGIFFAGQLDCSVRNNVINATNGAVATRTVGAALYGVYGKTDNRNMSVSDNTLTLKVTGSAMGLYGIYIDGIPVATSAAKTEISRNYMTGFSLPPNYAGRPFYAIYNDADTDSLFITSNTFTSSSISNSSTGTLSIINNSATVTSTISISNNTLSIGSYYPGSNNSIKLLSNSSGATSAPKMTLDNNLFTNFNFGTNIPNDNYDFIYNAGTNTSLSISSNTFVGFTGAGASTVNLINNSSTTYSFTLVNSNTCSGFTSTMSCSMLSAYNGQNSSPYSDNVVISNNSFDMGQALFNNFIGIKTREGNSGLEASRKQIFGNLVTNIRSGYFAGIDASYLGDGGGAGTSAIYNNTISSVSCGGVCYGLLSSPGNALLPTDIYGNTIQNISYSGINTFYGMSLTGGSNGLNLFKNKVAGLIATNNLFPIGIAVNAGTVIPDCTINIYNNIVGAFTATNQGMFSAMSLLSLTGNSHYRVYYNTLYSGTANTAIYGHALDVFSTFPADVRNNLIINQNYHSGFFGKPAGAISTAASTHSVSSDNNCFYSPCAFGADGLAVSTNSTYTNMGTVRTYLGGAEKNSFTENVTFASTSYTDAAFMTPSATVATRIESGAEPISWISTDFYGNPRNLNNPDVGAIEGNYIPLVVNDSLPPSFVNFGFADSYCSASQRTFTAQIQDVSGVGAGSLSPQIYYQVNAGSFTNTAGTLASGTSSAGIWSFTLNTAANYNDVISWFLIAQDNSTLSNISSFPPTNLVASSVNSISVFPSVNTYTVIMPLGGTYTVGAGGTFTSLTAAANAYNTACLTGPVTFILTNSLYDSTGETFPVTFGKNADASATNSLLIQPANGLSVSIVSSTLSTIPAPLKFLDASYITVDGNTVNASALNIVCSAFTNSYSASIWLASSTTNVGGNKYISLKNMEIKASAKLLSFYPTIGIVACANNTSLAQYSNGGIDNNHITIEGNHFQTLYIGVYGGGSTGSFSSLHVNNNWIVKNNLLGNYVSSTLTSVDQYGMYFQKTSQLAVSGNTLVNAIGNAYVLNVTGIYLGQGVTSATLAANIIRSYTGYFSSYASGAAGIIVDSRVSNNDVLICNNMISDLVSNGTDAQNNSGIVLGLSPVGGGGTKVLNNTIVLRMGSAYSGTMQMQSACIFLYNQVNTQIKNNILYTDNQNPGNTASRSYCIYNNGWNSYPLDVNDYNCYYAASYQNPLINSAFTTVTVTTLAALQYTTGQNAHALNVQPVFTSSIDVHLDATAPINSYLDNAGDTITLYTTDVDNQSRNLNTPDIGADEFTSTGNCTTAVGGTVSPASYTICSTGSVSILSSGTSFGAGTGFQWQVSPISGGTYSNITQGSGITGNNYNSSGLIPGIYYLRLNTSCATNSTTASSNEVVLTVLGPPTVSIVPSQAAICNGAIVTLTAAGANSYTWSNGATTSTTTVNPTMSATYYVAGKNSACSTVNSSSLTLFVGTNPTVVVTAVSSTVCAGTSATLIAGGASIYSWSSGSSGATITPSPTVATVYTVTGYNASGCYSTANRTIYVNPSPSLSISGASVICSGQSASLIVNGGTSYTWSTGSNSGTLVVNPSVTTSYTVSGDNASGCTSQNQFTVAVSTPTPLVIGGSLSICDNQTTTLLATGYNSYNWSNGITTPSISLSPTVSTTYTVIGSTGSCSSSAVIQVTVNASPSLSVVGNNSVCLGQSTTLTALGASIYQWSNGSFNPSQTLTPITNTTYAVTGTGTNGCSNTTSVAVISNSLPVIAIAQSANTVCAFNPVVFTASGASTYTWSFGGNSPVTTISPSTSSTFTVNGSSSAGCSGSQTVDVIVNQNPTLSIVPASFTVCAQTPVSYTASGASSYTWSNGGGSNPIANYTPVASSIYTLTAGHSLNSCTTSQTVSVLTNSLPIISISGSSSLCVGATATLMASGASSYLWNTAATTTFIIVSPSVNTNYLVTGTAANGCVGSATFGIATYSLPLIGVSANAVTVCSGSQAILTATGAVSYTWSGTGTNGSSVAVTPVAAIIYSVSGSSSAGCTATASIAVYTYSLPLLTVLPLSASVCPNTSVTYTAGSAFGYTWTNGGGNTSIASFTPSSSAVYTISTSEPSTGCITSKTVAAFTNSLPVIGISGGTAVCTGQSLTLTASGASSYSWDSGSQSFSNTVSPAITSTYMVSGTNAAGCVSSASTTVVTYSLPVLSGVQSATVVCQGSPVSFTVNGAATYSWINSSASTSVASFYPMANSVYTVIGYSQNACVSTETFSVATYSLPLVTVSPSLISVCAGNPVSYTALGASSYSWNTGINSAVMQVTPSVSGSYTVVGYAANSCASVAYASVSVFASPNLSVNGSASICAGSSVTLTAGGATTYTWQTGIHSASIVLTPASTTSYSVSGSIGSCTAVAQVTVAVNALPNVQATASSNTVCAGGTLVLNGSGATTYTWSGNVLDGVPFSLLNSSQYTVTGQNTSGCAASNTIFIQVFSLPSLSITSSDSLVCEGQVISVSSTGAVTYTWSNGTIGTSANYTIFATTNTISVSGSDVNACIGTNSFVQLLDNCTMLQSLYSNRKTLDIYPNPFAVYFTVTYNGFSGSALKVEILNYLGQLIKTESLQTASQKLYMDDFANGIYFVRISEQGRLVLDKKIIKQ